VKLEPEALIEVIIIIHTVEGLNYFPIGMFKITGTEVYMN
jgi:hypothetical protein